MDYLVHTIEKYLLNTLSIYKNTSIRNINNLNNKYFKLYGIRDEDSILQAADKIAKKIKPIDQICIYDDVFMQSVFYQNYPDVQLVTDTIIPEMKMMILSFDIQKHLANLYGRKIILDIFATDHNGRFVNVEIQNDSEGASYRRARYHASLCDSNIINPGTDFDNIPDSIIIFITRHDVPGKNKPIYIVRRMFDDINTPFDDGQTIIYVNGAYKCELPHPIKG